MKNIEGDKMLNIDKGILDGAPICFGIGRLIKDSDGSLIDSEIIFLNSKLRDFLSNFGVRETYTKISHILNSIDSGLTEWLLRELQTAVKNGETESELYSPPLKGWFRVFFQHHDNDIISVWFENITAIKMLIDSSQEIIKSKNLTLKRLAEEARKISGAKYCLINLFSEDGTSFTTTEIAGDQEDLPIVKKTLGFNPENKTWPTLSGFTDTFKNSDIHNLKIFDSFMGVNIPSERIRDFKESLNIGNISLCKIESDNNLLGILTLVFEKHKRLQNEYQLINYAQIIALFLIQKNLEKDNREKEAELKQKQSKLKKEKERLESVIKGINAGTWEWNIQTGITIFNERWAAMLGYSLEELEPCTVETWESLVIPEDLPLARKALQDHFEGKYEFYDTEFRMRHKNGRIIWVHDKGKVEKWTEDGKPLIMYGTHQDITERKTSELALKNAKKEKEEFFASISHDLKNPIHTIKGFASLLKEDLTDPEDIDSIDNILEASSTMLQLISNILDFSKAEAGKITIKKQKTDLRNIIIKNYKHFLQRATDKNIIMNYIIEDGIPEYIYTDPLRLNQIIMNLLDNAVKFTERGSVTFSVANLSKAGNKREIKFAVKDTGIGMTPEEKKRIFTSFSQANSDIEKKYGGTGLGLFISSKILELMGSELKIHTAPKKGSTFSFTLDCDETISL
jgi:PAS domain S-box-containing protein